MKDQTKSSLFKNHFSTEPRATHSSMTNEKKQISPLPKPDLSPITQKDMQFSLKCHGSYKKPKVVFPESPMKSPIQKYFTPVKIEGKNLFGTAPKKDVAFRKLNFDMALDEEVDNNGKEYKKFSHLLDNVEEKEEDSQSPYQSGQKFKDENIKANLFNNLMDVDPEPNFNNVINANYLNTSPAEMQSTPPQIKITNSVNSSHVHIHKMDKDFTILKTLSENKFDSVYKCLMNKNNKIYAVKKSYKTSCKNDLTTVKKIYNDLISNSSSKASSFCVNYLEYWVEEEIYDIIESSTHFTDKNLYILTEYYENGDLLDYLSKLEQHNYKFTPEFYWDIIFEMLAGVHFFHECGYLHLDIKPANFLVDNNGYIKLSDFGLSHKISDLSSLDDIFEGDSTYISPEVFNRTSLKDLDTKCDVYSLGLSFLEIMAKVELPKNGPLWRAMRTYEINTIPKEFFVNWNIKDINPFWELIQKMICAYNERMNIVDIVNTFPELNKRLNLLRNNQYQKSVSVPLFINTHNQSSNENDMVIESPRKA